MLIEKHIMKEYLTLKSRVDVTDPCYDSDVWCRMTVNNMQSGDYRCIYYTGEKLEEEEIQRAKEDYASIKDYSSRTEEEYLASAEKSIKGRCFVAEIQLKSRHFDVNSKRWKEIGDIGVDAGLAGFFSDKPDFTDKQWAEICEWMFKKDKVAYFKKDLGFWTSSGYGDGCYDVYAIEEEGKTIALKICF